MAEEQMRQCEGCGASIYREHLDTGIAGYWESQLLCAHCLQEKEKSGGQGGAKPSEDLETISLVDEEPAKPAAQSSSATQVRGLSETQLGMGTYDDSALENPADPASPMATRCRTFHTKLNDGAVAYLNREINEWIDRSASIRLKFATSTIGVFEGKRADPHLIITVFY
ncbi:MAG: hypothetical protein GY842_20460 [bacterium]|nr:hypothetical protein [bacterium]